MSATDLRPPTSGAKIARRHPLLVMLGGYAALAESAWMGFSQAAEVLDAMRTVPAAALRIIRLRGLLTREFSLAEASFILMVSFFISALLGAVRQILFNAQ
jgi:hypothetical protein